MMFRPFIDLRELNIKGNVLDVGLESCGIIYNIYKLNTKSSNFDVEYSEGKKGMEEIEKEYYDYCVCFFSLRYLCFLKDKNNMLDFIFKSLCKEGVIYIWDMNKGYGKYFNGIIRVMLPDRSIKRVKLLDLNVLNDTSMEGTIKILSDKFDIIDTKQWDGIYYIEAKKKLDTKDNTG